MSPEDRARIDGFLRGDDAPTREIHGWVRAVVAHRAWRLDRTEDLVQDVVLRLLNALGSDRFEGRSTLRTYVERVAKYTCLDAVRDARRVEFVELMEMSEPTTPPGDGVHERLEAEESARVCHAVLERLPDDCRDLLRRTLAEGVRYETLAAADGVAVGTIKSRVARCRERANRLRDRITREPRLWRRRA